MTRLRDLASGGDPVDPDLLSLLDAQGIETLEDARARGRAHWVAFFAQRDGFERDFEGLLNDYGLTWESAATADALRRDLYEIEIGMPALTVAQALGARTFADLFSHPRETVRLAMAERGGFLGELDDVLARHGIGW
ncbi:MAG: hypothetical protein AB7S26_20805 [Sandaracinaceae bacterium]